MGAGPILILAMLASANAGGALPSIKSAAELGSKWGVVTSILRTPERNRLVGGVPNSFHLAGQAVDIARKPGVRHADLDAAFRKAGYVIIESLDEGDHSHFAFQLRGSAPLPARAKVVQAAASAGPEKAACAKTVQPITGLEGRRRPDRFEGCTDTPDATAAAGALNWANQQPGSRTGS